MKKLLLSSLIAILSLLFDAGRGGVCFAQNVGINNTGNAPNSSAMLDVDASPANNKGMLIPRLTTAQQNAISNPATGLMIYNTDCNTINYYNGATWIAIGNTGSVTTPGTIAAAATTVCQNSTSVAYSVSTVSGATGYNWSMPPGSAVATGQGTNSITVNFGATSGNICVTAANACGSSNASCTAIAVVNGAPVTPTASSASIASTSFTLNWTSSTGATGYYIDVSTDNTFTINGDFVTGFNNFSAGNVLTTNVTGLSCNTNYYCRVRAANICGSGSNSATLTVTTLSAGPAAPTAGTSIAGYNQIVFNWNTVSGASGYAYNTTNNYGTATQTANTTFTQTSLTCNTLNNLYVWSYTTGCGGSASPTTLSVTTAPCITGSSSSTFCSYTSNCTGSTFTDSRDSKVYNEVQIYNQCWMAQNLNWGTQVTGTSSAVAYGNKFCYGDVAGNCTIYGGLYQWQTMIMNGGSSTLTPPGPQGVCPPGWHVPTDYEWGCMQENLGEPGADVLTTGTFYSTIGVNLKIANSATYMGQTGSYYWDNQTGHTNSSGFTAIAGGNYSSGYANLDQTGYWATSTLYSGSQVSGRSMYYGANPDGVWREYNNSLSTTGFGWEVRCVSN